MLNDAFHSMSPYSKGVAAPTSILRNNCSENFAKLTKRHVQWSPTFSKVNSFQKIRLYCRYIIVNFKKYFRAALLPNIYE